MHVSSSLSRVGPYSSAAKLGTFHLVMYATALIITFLYIFFNLGCPGPKEQPSKTLC